MLIGLDGPSDDPVSAPSNKCIKFVLSCKSTAVLAYLILNTVISATRTLCLYISSINCRNRGHGGDLLF